MPPPSAANLRFLSFVAASSFRNLKFKSRTRFIELLVVLRFRSSYHNMPRALTNLGIGPLAWSNALARQRLYGMRSAKPGAAVMTFTPKGKADPKQQQEAAAALAVTALGFIAGEPERLGPVLATTGNRPGSIPAAASEPEF